MGTYKLAPGFREGSYGLKQVGLKSTGNELPDYIAQIFLDKGIIEPEGEPKKRSSRKEKK